MVARRRRSTIVVTVDKANNLRAADISLLGGGKSDPYVKCEIRGRPYHNFTTKTIPKTLNPVWSNERYELDCCDGDALEFTVFDKDFLKDDMLGKAVLEYKEFYPNGYNSAITLQDAGKKQQGKATLTVNIEIESPTIYSGPYDPLCFIKIKSASKLRVADGILGKSDPYCICRIPNKPHSEVKTKVIWKDLDPVWNEDYEIVDFKEGDDLEFKVMDFDTGRSKHDLLGEFTLRCSEFFDQPYDEPIRLHNTNGHPSILEVSINVHVPEQPKELPPDPGAHVVSGQTWPVPFTLRSMETGRVHRLAAYTKIGRSSTELDPSVDLILNGPGTRDISRLHATIKTWRQDDSDEWFVRVYKKGKHGRVRGSFGLQVSDPLHFEMSRNLPHPSDRTSVLRSSIAELIQWEFDPRRISVVFNDSPQETYQGLPDVTTVVSFVLEIPPEDNTNTVMETIKTRLEEASAQVVMPLINQFILNSEDDRNDSGLSPYHVVAVSRPIVEEVYSMIGPDWSCDNPSCRTFNDGRLAYCEKCNLPLEGIGAASGGGHKGGGVSVQRLWRSAEDSEFQQADGIEGVLLKPGDILRFGVNEQWVLDRAALFARSQLACIATRVANPMDQEDPLEMRNLKVPSIACHHALQACKTWFELSRVVLEWLGEPDEPPCVECIEVQDELNASVSRHMAPTLEEQEVYPVRRILDEMRMGMTIRLKLCSDPCLLAPVLAHLAEHRKKMEKIFADRGRMPD